MIPRESFSLLFSFVLVLAVGYGLRRSGRLAPSAADTLNLLVTDVTMPALIIATLSARPVPFFVLRAIVTATLVLLVSLALGALAGRVLRLSRHAEGAVVLTSGFANTGFLGLPFVLALYPRAPEAGMTAVLIDAFVTTLWIYTAGITCARRYGMPPAAADLPAAADPEGAAGTAEAGTPVAISAKSGEAAASAPPVAAPRLIRLLLTPPSLSVMVGLAMSLLGLRLPSFLDRTAALLGGATAPMVFLALGVRLDLRSLIGRVRPMLAVAGVRLLVAPALMVALTALVGLRGPEREAAVLETAMPSAMMSAVIVDRYGCDGPLATGAVVLTMLLSLLTLPGWLAALRFLAAHAP
jgi:auxin efflux carrier (AEC)